MHINTRTGEDIHVLDEIESESVAIDIDGDEGSAYVLLHPSDALDMAAALEAAARKVLDTFDD